MKHSNIKDIAESIPAYIKIYYEIKNDILNCKYLPNEKLPSENKLTKHYQVSRYTIQHAFQLLVTEGLVSRKQGQASFVCPLNTSNHEIIKLELGCLNPPGILLTEYCYSFARRVQELSSGQIKIEINHSSVLGGGAEQMQNTSNGTQDMFCAAEDWLATLEESWAVTSYPFLFHGMLHLRKAVAHEVSEKMRNILPKIAGVRCLADNWFRPSRLVMSKQAIFDQNDLSTLCVGVPDIPLYSAAWSSLGAQTKTIMFGERTRSLAENAIDMTDVNWDIIISEEIYKEAKFAILTRHNYSRACIIINEQKFQSLRSDAQNILMEAAQEVGDLYTKHLYDTYLEHKKILLDNNVTFIESNFPSWRRKIESFLCDTFGKESKNMKLYKKIHNL